VKVSVIDLGFNSIKLVNYDVRANGTFKAYQQEGVKVKLGEGLNHRTGYLSGLPVQRTIDALKMFRDIIDFNSIDQVLPVATSVVREASNKDDFLKHIYDQTGFQFKVLSGQEEGLYSYVGALKSICLPTTLFFDLGGGSLELVYTENYFIKKIRSYPLGALRMSNMFGVKNGTFSKRNYSKMAHYILDILPDREEFDMSWDTTLIGVGGTLRAMARYDQELNGYGLDKIHQYEMHNISLSSIAKNFYKMDADQLVENNAVGADRAGTITAGSAIINLLMEKFDFERIVVSAQGLREGVVSVFVRDPTTFYNRKLNNVKAKGFVTFSCKPEMLPHYTLTFVKPLVSAGLMREKEKMILAQAIREVVDLPLITNLNNLFHIMIDEDNAFLSHSEQLVLALSIIHARKEKAADWLFSRYKSILESQNKASIGKISACLVLSSILEKAKIEIKLSIKGKKADIKIIPSSRQFVPATLLAEALKKFERAFGISVNGYIVSEKQAATKESIMAIDRK
jgi:exopolyphosphatase / guanosine-5'-triphosphate,3'-diphosphate pyrophosphatase